MADIELVIKIPEDVYKRTIFYREFRDLNDCITTIKALEKAITLPEHHGDLIDRDSLELDCDWSDYYDGFSAYSESQVRLAPTIIEAEGGEEENDTW